MVGWVHARTEGCGQKLQVHPSSSSVYSQRSVIRQSKQSAGVWLHAAGLLSLQCSISVYPRKHQRTRLQIPTGLTNEGTNIRARAYGADVAPLGLHTKFVSIPRRACCCPMSLESGRGGQGSHSPTASTPPPHCWYRFVVHARGVYFSSTCSVGLAVRDCVYEHVPDPKLPF